MSQVQDKETNEVIFDDEASYSLRQFIKIAKKSPEGKKQYTGCLLYTSDAADE